MKEKFLAVVFASLVLTFCNSCQKEDNFKDRSQEENSVRTIVKSNSPDAQISVMGVRSGGEIVKFTTYWEEEVVTKSYGGQTIATCSDPRVLITIEKYVNGSLRSQASGNSRVVTNIVIKDDFRKKPR